MAVMGVDGCPTGWVAILIDKSGYLGAAFGREIGELVQSVSVEHHIDVVGIDIPVGLSETAAEREADRLVYNALGPRRSSLFMTPPRAVLELAEDPVAASDLCRRLTGKGVSRQSLGLAKKVLEVDRWWRTAGWPVLEIHPELSFSAMAGHPLGHRKKSWAGQEERRELLRAAGVNIPGDLGRAGLEGGPDDILDAAAVAWTARNYTEGRATAYPTVQARSAAVARIWA